MNNKRGSAILWILIIAVLFIIIFGTVFYFLFIHISESKAREIIRTDYYNNPSDVCNRFYAGGDKCPAFMDCYVDKAINKLQKNLAIQFAKDIKQGKSSAIDSYSLVNGKEIGEECLAEILKLPEGLKVNINEPEYSKMPEEIKQYIILEDIGDFEFDHSSNYTIPGSSSMDAHDLIMVTYNRIGFSGSSNEGAFIISVYKNNEDSTEEFNKVYSEKMGKISRSDNVLGFADEKTLKGIRVFETKDFIYSPPKIHNYWVKDNYFIETVDLLITDPLYNFQTSEKSPKEFLDSLEEPIKMPIFEAYFNKYS